jgi:hypothetical protein
VVRTDQEAKEDLEALQVHLAGPQMRPRRRPSQAVLKERTIFSVASKLTEPNMALMAACTVAKHITERPEEITLRQQQCSPHNAWRTGVSKLGFEMDIF